MKILLSSSVLDAALTRIRWIFSEFPDVMVNISGGKDSTVVLNLTLQVAEELGRLPVPVMFLDQEAEWQATIDSVRQTMDDERVDPRWLQVPIRLFNATSPLSPWLNCWDPDTEWIRPKEPDSIHDNTFGTDRFAQMFTNYARTTWPDRPVAMISGVRAQESPARHLGLTTYPCYKHITWGRASDKKRQHIAFYPIYDWQLADVWKAIHEHGWPYCRLYDELYRYGIPPTRMRVSNIHHETAFRDLWILQEIEPQTWDAVTARLTGMNTAAQLNIGAMKPKTLPSMFASWEQYRDHLLYNLILDPEIRARMQRTFASNELLYRHDASAYADLIQTEISAILVNDYEGTKISQFHASHITQTINRSQKRGGTYAE